MDRLVTASHPPMEPMPDQGLPADRLAHARELLIGSYALDLQRVADRNRLAARGLYVHGRLPTFADYEEAIRAVTPERLRAVAAEVLDPERAVAVIVLPGTDGE
jgi:predicted Zn-dependent peptidase